MWLHIRDDNIYLSDWKKQGFNNVIEWSLEQNIEHIRLADPDIDTNMFPNVALDLYANLLKLIDYGGVVVDHKDVKPREEYKIIPSKLTILKNYRSDGEHKRTYVMSAPRDDEICKKYLNILRKDMVNEVWIRPNFGTDVDTFR